LLTSNFSEVFEKENSIILNKKYDFSKILHCQLWDKIIILGGPEADRLSIFINEGIIIPEIDYQHRMPGSLLFYIIKDGKLIAPPMEFYDDGFLYFSDFNNDDYVILNRKDAIFNCIELDYIGDIGQILTFKLVKEK